MNLALAFASPRPISPSGIRIDAGLPQQRSSAGRKSDELAMGKGISNEVARSGLAGEAFRTFLGEDRRPAVGHVLGGDQSTVRRFDTANFGGDDFHRRPFLVDRCLQLSVMPHPHRG